MTARQIRAFKERHCNRGRLLGEVVAQRVVARFTACRLLPDTASLEAFLVVEMRDRVSVLVAEVMLLQSNAEAQQMTTITALRAESQILRDEVAQLKACHPAAIAAVWRGSR